jgi:hypothetical protein
MWTQDTLSMTRKPPFPRIIVAIPNLLHREPTPENDRRAARLFGAVPGSAPEPLPTVWRANAELERLRAELYGPARGDGG